MHPRHRIAVPFAFARSRHAFAPLLLAATVAHAQTAPAQTAVDTPPGIPVDAPVDAPADAPAKAQPEAARAFTAKVAGRIHWDIARFDDDGRGAANPDADTLRAAWLDVSGTAFGLGYKFEIDAASDKVFAKDVYVSRKFKAGTLTVGQFKQYVTLDDRVSGNHMVFVERSLLAQALAPTYRLGVGWLSARDGMTLGASAYSLESIDVWQTKGRALALRGTWAPRRDEGDVLHLGASIAHEAYDQPGAEGAPALRVRPRPVGAYGEASRSTLLDFGGGRDANVGKYLVEVGGVRGAWSYQGELGGARYDNGASDGRLLAGYAQAAWMISGEVRPYDAKAGRFGRIQPKGRAGAWELAVRYDTLRGRQHGATGARVRDAAVDAWTVGLNWYPRAHVRLMFDWVDGRSRDRLADRTADRTRALLGRLQLDF